MINQYLVPLAVPMLLFDSNLRRVLRDTGSLLVAFAVGAVATVVGTLVAYPIIPMRETAGGTAGLAGQGWKVACALCARHIGGAINFVAVAETLQVAGSVVSAAIAADNVVVALYFAFLFALAKPGEPTSEGSSAPVQDYAESVFDPESIDMEDKASSEITLSSMGLAISISAGLVTAGRFLTQAFLPKGTSALPLTSLLTVLAATLFPSFFARIRAAGTALGILCIQMFFAASGAAGSVISVMRQAPSLFAFSALQIAIHFGFLMAVGRGVMKLPVRELFLSSNANVGGPTTAAAMAQAKEWPRLVVPALLIGILGYAVATGIALALGPVLVRLPILGS
jgi:uncharacterized membrane protein